MDTIDRGARFEQLLGISGKAEQRFLDGDRFGVVFALIEAGISDEEYQEFLRINPYNWYDPHTRAVLDQAILFRGVSGSPMMLREDCDFIVMMNRRRVKEVIH